MTDLFTDTIIAYANDPLFVLDSDSEKKVYDSSDIDEDLVNSILEDIEYGAKLGEKYNISIEDQHGGEGQGDDYYYIIKINDRLFKIPGYYSSWEGSTLEVDDVFEVEAYEETITAYRKIS